MAELNQQILANKQSIVKCDLDKIQQLCLTPKHQDSDGESIETNDSNNDNKLNPIFINKQFQKVIPEIDVQPKRKIFFSAEQKLKYIEDYQKKYKTEVCKNWQIKGNCPYGNQCCFAHGYNELQNKTHLKTTYKTKPCKKFFVEGYCSYGYRCQYLHSDIKQYPQYQQYLENLFQFKSLPLSQIWQFKEQYSDQLNYIEKNEQMPEGFKRLNMFNSLEEKEMKSADFIVAKSFPTLKLLLSQL